MSGVLWVGLGGFLGAILRYLLSGWTQRWAGGTTLPFGTLAVNLAGCFVIGLLSHLFEARNIFGADARLFLFIGLLGAFTTFSTFEQETLTLLRQGNTLSAFSHIAIHVVLGLGMVWLGRLLAEAIWK